MVRLALLALPLFLLGSTPPAPQATAADPETRRIQEAYRAARPSDRDLAVFKLDWAASFKEARERAAREKRPVFFVATMQLKDAGNLRSGHC